MTPLVFWAPPAGGFLGEIKICVGPERVVSVCAGPAAVGNLSVAAANCSSLSFTWTPSNGHVDVYDLSLFRVSEGRQPAGGARGPHQVSPQHFPPINAYTETFLSGMCIYT